MRTVDDACARLRLVAGGYLTRAERTELGELFAWMARTRAGEPVSSPRNQAAAEDGHGVFTADTGHAGQPDSVELAAGEPESVRAAELQELVDEATEHVRRILVAVAESAAEVRDGGP